MMASRPGYVYILGEPSGTFKIGRTSDINNRLKTHGVLLPFPVTYVHVMTCNDMYGLEKYFHDFYADKRVNGEWFALTPDDIEALQSLYHVDNLEILPFVLRKRATPRIPRESAMESFRKSCKNYVMRMSKKATSK